MRLVIKVEDIAGTCPVYKEGDRIVLDEGYKVNLEETDCLCMHSLSSLLPYHVALSKGVDPVDIGLAREGKDAFLQCLDPHAYTGGGTVTFRVTRE